MSEGFEQQFSADFSGQLPGRHEQPIKQGLEKAGTINRLRTANALIRLMIFTINQNWEMMQHPLVMQIVQMATADRQAAVRPALQHAPRPAVKRAIDRRLLEQRGLTHHIFVRQQKRVPKACIRAFHKM